MIVMIFLIFFFKRSDFSDVKVIKLDEIRRESDHFGKKIRKIGILHKLVYK